MSDAEPLWDFAVRVYARAGVENTCLALQDDWHADVPVVFYLLWAGLQGRRLSTEDIEATVARVEAWQTRVVGPIRQLRRALRAAGDMASALVGDMKAVRDDLKQVELDAERRELEFLSSITVGSRGEPGETTTKANLITYLDFLGVPADLREAHLHLVDAATD